MSNQHQQSRANAARAALSAREQTNDDLATRIQDHLADLGHLCDAENLIFTDILARALRHWAVERIDPNSLAAGPTVEIGIGSEGLPDKPKNVPASPCRRRAGLPDRSSLHPTHPPPGPHSSGPFHLSETLHELAPPLRLRP